MFGFSLPKLLILAAIIAVVWYGAKIIQRRDEVRRAVDEKTRRNFGKGKEKDTPVAEDLVECRVCGAYVAAQHATNCGREDCPY